MKKFVVRSCVQMLAVCILCLAGYLIANAAVRKGWACFSLPGGNKLRTAQCLTPGGGLGGACNTSASCTGTCWEGEHSYLVLACNNYVESYERTCFSGHEPFTCKDQDPIACITWTGYWVNTNCNGNSCSVSALGNNCTGW